MSRNSLAVIVLLASSVGATVDQLLPAVSDLIFHLERPLRVLALTCWPMDARALLWRSISAGNRGIMMQFGEPLEDNLPVHDPNQHQTIVVVDSDCPGTHTLLLHAGQRLYFRLRWIIVDGSEHPKSCSDFRQFFDDLEVLASSEVHYLCTHDAGGYQILLVYRYALQEPLIVENVGRWHPDRGLCDLQPKTSTSSRRRNFGRFNLRASLVITHNETLSHLDDYRDKQVDTITKMNYFLTLYVAVYLNATVNFTYVNSWGYRDPATGHFSGMIGDLQSNRADLGGTALFFTQDRIKEIDYLAMTTPTRAMFIFRSPKLSFTDNVFVLPFDIRVWCCIVSFIGLSALLLAAIMTIEFRYTDIRYGRSEDVTIWDTLLNMFGTTCQQGSYIDPTSTPGRCLVLLSLVVLMFLYASYSANIVALIQSPSNKIRTVGDLLASRLKTGAEDTVYNRYYFKHEMEPVRKSLYDRKMRNKDGTENFLALSDGVELLRRGQYAFHVERGVCYKVISETFQEEEKCGLQEIEYLNIIDPYYAVQKNSSFRESIRIGLFKLREFGIQGREHRKLYTKKPECGGSSSFVPVSLIDVWPALVSLGWGYLLALLVLAGEYAYRAVRRRHRFRPRLTGTPK